MLSRQRGPFPQMESQQKMGGWGSPCCPQRKTKEVVRIKVLSTQQVFNDCYWYHCCYYTRLCHILSFLSLDNTWRWAGIAHSLILLGRFRGVTLFAQGHTATLRKWLGKHPLCFSGIKESQVKIPNVLPMGLVVGSENGSVRLSFYFSPTL